MLRYLLDTNICIYVVKNQPSDIRKRFNAHIAELAISAVTLAELLYGVEKSAWPARNRGVVEGFAARLEVLSFGSKAASHYGQIRAGLEQKGTPIGPYDLMIAAHARAEGLTLVTNNQREFARVPGIQIENWLTP